MSANANALYLLADHIKLSLLERQRAKALDLLQDNKTSDASGGSNGSTTIVSTDHDAQDGHISRSLDQFQEGLEALQRDQERLEGEGDSGKAQAIADALPSLKKQLDTLTAQFHGDATTSTTTPPVNKNKPLPKTKAVRFRDDAAARSSSSSRATPFDDDLEAQRAGLFDRYTDDDPTEGRSAAERYSHVDNQELHQMHQQIIADQDAQLDDLSASISRQRELSMQIGDELDSHVAMLEEAERVTDRHQGRIDRARRQVGHLARSAGECKQMVAIVVLIIVLILLIIILK